MNAETFDFGNGPVPAHRHKNPDGSVGGWVADSSSVESTVYVSGNAQVFGDAQVSGNARVFGDARVSGNAWVQTQDDWMSGTISGFLWTTFKSKNGDIYVSQGCKTFTLNHWLENLDTICAQSNLQNYKRQALATLHYISVAMNSSASEEREENG